MVILDVKLCMVCKGQYVCFWVNSKQKASGNILKEAGCEVTLLWCFITSGTTWFVPLWGFLNPRGLLRWKSKVGGGGAHL